MKPAARSIPLELAALALAHGAALPPVWAEEVPPQRVEVTAGERTARPGSLRSDIVKTESIGAAEIARSNATNINEAVDNRPGIAVQVECSICNVRNVLLNNLPGRFTTLLIDGVPIYSSVSSAYGLDSVSVWGVERIDIESLWGQVLPFAEKKDLTPKSRPRRAALAVGARRHLAGWRRGSPSWQWRPGEIEPPGVRWRSGPSVCGWRLFTLGRQPLRRRQPSAMGDGDAG